MIATPVRGGLETELRETSTLSSSLVDRLYALHARHFDGADPHRFRADLAAKQWVILLRDAEGLPVGYSTQALQESVVRGRRVRAVFSGDTLVDRAHWGSLALVRAWGRFVGERLREEPDQPLYWLLISKGHRTYLFLPLFFRRYFPCFSAPIPSWERSVRDTLAIDRFGDRYDPAAGLYRPVAGDRLRPELDSSSRRLRNPHVRFFRHANPDYLEGVELVCLAEIGPENLRGAALAGLREGMAAG